MYSLHSSFLRREMTLTKSQLLNIISQKMVWKLNWYSSIWWNPIWMKNYIATRGSWVIHKWDRRDCKRLRGRTRLQILSALTKRLQTLLTISGMRLLAIWRQFSALSSIVKILNLISASNKYKWNLIKTIITYFNVLKCKIDKAEAVLKRQKEALIKNTGEDLSNEFYKYLRVTQPFRQSIKDKSILSQRFELCQVMKRKTWKN